MARVTHADVHVAAALDPVGGRLGVREFLATAAGYAEKNERGEGFGFPLLRRAKGAAAEDQPDECLVDIRSQQADELFPGRCMLTLLSGIGQ